jgi:hypothetical protein
MMSLDLIVPPSVSSLMIIQMTIYCLLHMKKKRRRGLHCLRPTQMNAIPPR